MDSTFFIGALVSLLVALPIAIYFSDYRDDVAAYIATRLFRAKAETEKTALQHAATGMAGDFLKDQLKKNPVVGNDELNEVTEGLGEEARQGMAGGKLGEHLSKALRD